ncbi:unnamed protein product [Miscanthus lutarioriparius]|uniref:Uncharacterized protein n=1 Tax=Miscanthus lutarioriparius TaxID=422564 RepID=A0A811QMA7_9POAL|nr:unnamed protein product [Miscanthus lutarioriparius]
MASQASNVVRPSDAELLQAQADLWWVSLSYLTPMSLRCAVELGIPTAIHRHGRAASPTDLIPALSLPSAKLPFLRRLLRLLPVRACSPSTRPRRRRGAHQPHLSGARLYLDALPRSGDGVGRVVQEGRGDAAIRGAGELHGATLFQESLESLDADFHNMANEDMDAHDNFGIEIALREFRDLFEGIQSMTYFCGTSGDDKFARAIVKAFPHIKCTVLAPPKMIGATKPDDGAMINYVEGDMFNFIPPAQTVALKLVLHHWTDEDCVKILAQCRKVIPSREDGGKVIIGDILIDHSGPMLETHLLMDIGMMTMTKGRQRDENEWRDIFMKAGFSD